VIERLLLIAINTAIAVDACFSHFLMNRMLADGVENK
jgi:hypothetical protein